MLDETTEFAVADTPEGWMQLAMFLRGSMMTNYAHIEFLYADLFFRCLTRPEYQDIEPKLKQNLADRARLLVRIADRPNGPLYKYRLQLASLADRASGYEDIRHFLAHGVMIVMKEAELMLKLANYRTGKGGRVEQGNLELSLADCQTLNLTMTLLCSDVVRLIADIVDAEKLDAVSGANPSP